MSNQEPSNELSTSSDCLMAGGVHETQSIAARTALG